MLMSRFHPPRPIETAPPEMNPRCVDSDFQTSVLSSMGKGLQQALKLFSGSQVKHRT